MNRDARPIATCLVVLVWLVSGCGPAQNARIEVTTTRPAGLVVVADDYLFLPASLAVSVGEFLWLRNVGRLEHSWTVLTDSIEQELEIRTVSPLIDVRARPGDTVRVERIGLASECSLAIGEPPRGDGCGYG